MRENLQADLARETGTDPAAMVCTVGLMIRHVRVRKQDHPSDRRRWEMQLTELGEALEKKIKPVFRSSKSGFTSP